MGGKKYDPNSCAFLSSGGAAPLPKEGRFGTAQALAKRLSYEAGHEIPQSHAIAGELDWIGDVNSEQGNGVAVWQLDGADLRGGSDELGGGDDVLWRLEKLKRTAGKDVLQNGAVDVSRQGLTKKRLERQGNGHFQASEMRFNPGMSSK
jgi:hypothetical protein